MDNKNYHPLSLIGDSANLEIRLSEALANRNIQDFRAALKLGAKPLATDSTHLSVLEKALKTPGCAEFVEECLKAGCDPNYINTYYNKALINYAVESCDPQIMKALLANPGVNVYFEYAELTPLNFLAKNLNQKNADNVFKCLEILLEYGASPNKTDQRSMTLLDYLMINNDIDDIKKQEFIQVILQRSDIDIGLRKILEEKYPDVKLLQNSQNITYHILLTDIRNNEMLNFEQRFMDNLKYFSEEENLQLLFESIERGAILALDLIMTTGVNYNKTLRNNNTAIEIAWINGNWYALDKLLQISDIKLRRQDNPLSCVVRKLHETSLEEFRDYWKCFYILVDSEKIDINKMDRSRSTALHYAVKYRHIKAIKELLKRGADICIKNVYNDLAITGIKPSILEQHFNECISSNDGNLWDENFEILINFKNFIPEKNSSEEWKEVMTPIAFIANTKDYCYLLQHPVITSFLFFQWCKVFLAYYINFSIFIIYACSVITHAVFKFYATEYETALLISGLLSWLGILYLIIRESFQFIICPLRFLCTFSNYLEVSLITLSVMTCTTYFEFDEETQRNIAICNILLAAVEISFLVGSLPISSISTHMLMLKAVCISFLKSFILYSLFIIAFTLCFYIKNQSKLTKDNDNYFHSFPNPLVAFVKTIVMLTGEFDAASLTFNSDFSYVLFLSFVFFMTIILFNLLNGLAVSNTQAIQDQAEYNYIICRTRLLETLEKLVVQPYRHTKSFVNYQPFRFIIQYIKNRCPHLSTVSQIAILPNDNNKVVLTKLKSNNRTENVLDNDTRVPLTDEVNDMQQHQQHQQNLLPCCLEFIICECSTMDQRIVKLAMDILERKSEENAKLHSTNTEKKLDTILKYIAKQET